MAKDLTILVRRTMSMSQENKEIEDITENRATDTTKESDVNDTTSNAAYAEMADEAGIKLRADLEEQKDKYIRLFAEFDNFKKRTAKERLELIQTAGAEVIKSLLPVLDDFDRAEKSIETATDIEAVKQGLLLIKEKLNKSLQQKGLQSMQSIGESFDAEWHEAITEIPAPTEDMKGKIIDEVEKGYVLNDKIIRYAKVIVGK
jgi:molecular chaperone GrpE